MPNMYPVRRWVSGRRQGGVRLAPFLIALFACATDADLGDCSALYRGNAYYATWWGGGSLHSEKAYTEEVKAQVARCNGGAAHVEVRKADGSTSAYADGQKLKDELPKLLPAVSPGGFPGTVSPAGEPNEVVNEQRSPVDAVAINGGRLVCDLAQQGRIQKLNEPARQLRASLPYMRGLYYADEFESLETATHCAEGSVSQYATPLAIHQLNLVLLNLSKICARFAATPASSQPSWCTTGRVSDAALANPELALAGDDSFKKLTNFVRFLESIPAGSEATFILPTQEKWPISQLVVQGAMNTLDAADSDGPLYDQFRTAIYAAEANSGDPAELSKLQPKFEALLEQVLPLLKLGRLAATMDPSETAAGLASKVGRGEVLMIFTGSWSKQDAAAAAQGSTHDVIAAVPFPGSQARYVFGSDVLVIPTHPANPPEQSGNLASKSSAAGMVLAWAVTPRSVEGADLAGATSLFKQPRGNAALVPGLTHVFPEKTFDQLDPLLSEWVEVIHGSSVIAGETEETRRRRVVECLMALPPPYGPCPFRPMEPVVADSIKPILTYRAQPQSGLSPL